MNDDLNLWTGVPVSALPDGYQRLLARLDILEEAIVYTKYHKDGGAVEGCHQVSPSGLAAALSGVPITTGLLPQGTLFYARQAGGERIGLYLPARVHKLAVQMGGKRRRLKVPLPPLVFVGQGGNYGVYAVKQWPGATERLYHAPLPNVYLGGNICTGDVEFPPCSLATIRASADAFLASDFNTHLVQTRSDSHRDNVLELWQELHDAGAAEYPLGDLLPCSHPGKLSELVGGEDV